MVQLAAVELNAMVKVFMVTKTPQNIKPIRGITLHFFGIKTNGIELVERAGTGNAAMQIIGI